MLLWNLTGETRSSGLFPKRVYKFNYSFYLKIYFETFPEPSVGGFPNYIRENNIVYGIAYDVINDVMYASVPRSAPGVPATLVMLKNVTNIRDLNPIFNPFPRQSVNQLRNCDFKPKSPPKKTQKRRKVPNPKISHLQLDYSFDERYDLTHQNSLRRSSECDTDQRLISTFEPVLDKCGRLWVIDTGVLENNGEVIVKNAQLWAFSVEQGPEHAKLIRRFDFPKNVVQTGRGLFGLTVDILHGQCDETFVYIPNLIDGRIVVYDFFKHDAWYFENYSFEGDATESDFTYEEGLAIRFKAGIASIALGPEEKDSPGHFRTVYYTAGSSTGEYSISTRVLRDQKKSPDITDADLTLVGYRGKDSQAMASVFDEDNGVLFFAEVQSGRVRCWNTQKPLRPENIETIFESKKFVYGSHISVSERGWT